MNRRNKKGGNKRAQQALQRGLLPIALLLGLIGTATAASEWQTYLEDSFDNLETMFFSGQEGEASYAIDESGRYIVDGANSRGDSLSALTDNLYYYYVETTCEVLDGTGGDLAYTGLIFHYNKKVKPGEYSYYVFYVYADGYYGAKRVLGDDVSIVLPLTRTELTDIYGRNVLAVDAQGTHFDLYLNGRFVDSFVDVRIDGGGYGFYTSKETRAAFDDFVVKVERRNTGYDATEIPQVVENRGGSGFGGYEPVNIPRDPNRPVYPWEVGVDKTGKAPNAEPQQEYETADVPVEVPVEPVYESPITPEPGPADPPPSDPPPVEPEASKSQANAPTVTRSAPVPEPGPEDTNTAAYVPSKSLEPKTPAKVDSIEETEVILSSSVPAATVPLTAKTERQPAPLELQPKPQPTPAATATAKPSETASHELPLIEAKPVAGSTGGELSLLPEESDRQVTSTPLNDGLIRPDLPGELPPPGAHEPTPRVQDTQPEPKASTAASEPTARVDDQAKDEGAEETEQRTRPQGLNLSSGDDWYAAVETPVRPPDNGKAPRAEADSGPKELVTDPVKQAEARAAESRLPLENGNDPLSLTPVPDEPAIEPQLRLKPKTPDPLVGKPGLISKREEFTDEAVWASGASGASNYRYFGAAYEIDNLAAETMAISFQQGSYGDLELLVDSDYLDGLSYVGYGVAARFIVDAQGQVSYYGMFISRSGEFLLLKVVNGTEEILRDWTATSLLSPTQPNRIGLRIIGGKVGAMINGEEVVTILDSDIPRGGYALLAGPGVSARYDNLSLRGIPAPGT